MWLFSIALFYVTVSQFDVLGTKRFFSKFLYAYKLPPTPTIVRKGIGR